MHLFLRRLTAFLSIAGLIVQPSMVHGGGLSSNVRTTTPASIFLEATLMARLGSGFAPSLSRRPTLRTYQLFPERHALLRTIAERELPDFLDKAVGYPVNGTTDVRQDVAEVLRAQIQTDTILLLQRNPNIQDSEMAAEIWHLWIQRLEALGFIPPHRLAPAFRLLRLNDFKEPPKSTVSGLTLSQRLMLALHRSYSTNIEYDRTLQKIVIVFFKFHFLTYAIRDWLAIYGLKRAPRSDRLAEMVGVLQLAYPHPADPTGGPGFAFLRALARFPDPVKAWLAVHPEIRHADEARFWHDGTPIFLSKLITGDLSPRVQSDVELKIIYEHAAAEPISTALRFAMVHSHRFRAPDSKWFANRDFLKRQWHLIASLYGIDSEALLEISLAVKTSLNRYVFQHPELNADLPTRLQDVIEVLQHYLSTARHTLDPRIRSSLILLEQVDQLMQGENQNPSDAEFLLIEGLKRWPTDEKLWERLMIFYETHNDPTSAEFAASSAEEEDRVPGTITAQRILAQAYDKRHNFRMAIKYGQHWLDAAPTDTEALRFMSRKYRWQENPARALNCLQSAFGLDPSDPRIVLDLMNYYLDIGDYDEAAAFGTDYLAHHAPDKEILKSRSMALKKGYKSDKEKYKHLWLEATLDWAMASINTPIAYIELAKASMANELLELALASAKQAFEIYPSLSDLPALFRELFYRLNRSSIMTEPADRLLILKPHELSTYLYAANAYQKTKNPQKALELVELGLKKFPNELHLMNIRVYCLLDMRRLIPALGAAEEGVRKHPNEESALIALALTHFRMRHYEAVIEVASRIVTHTAVAAQARCLAYNARTYLQKENTRQTPLTLSA